MSDPEAELRAAVERLVLAIVDVTTARAAASRPGNAVSIDEACARLGIKRTALYGLMDRGELRSVKVGRRRLVPTAELARLTDPDGHATRS